jgi:hypothetical protein
VGWDFGYCGHYWPTVPAPDDRWWWLWRNWWNEEWQGKPTCLDPISNPGRRGGKPATNRFSYGAAVERKVSLGWGWCEMAATLRGREPGSWETSVVGRRYQAAQWGQWLKALVCVWYWSVKCSHELLRVEYMWLPIQTPSIVINTWPYVNLLQVQMMVDCFILIKREFLERGTTRVWRQNLWRPRKGPNPYQKRQLKILPTRLQAFTVCKGSTVHLTVLFFSTPTNRV